MDELRPLTEYINTALGAAGIGGAAFAANWVRNIVKKYLAYIELKMARKLALPLDPETRKMVEAVAMDVIKRIVEERKRARTTTG